MEARAQMVEVKDGGSLAIDDWSYCTNCGLASSEFLQVWNALWSEYMLKTKLLFFSLVEED